MMAHASVRSSQPVRDALHMAQVAQVMKEFDFDKKTAMRFLEVERSWTGVGLPKGERS